MVPAVVFPCPRTNAVVANWVVLVLAAAVGAAGVPVNVGDARAAREVSEGWTWSARAYRRDVPTAAVPSTTGVVADACATTNAVVASWVVLVSTAAVGAAGTPVNVGAASGA
jgi:hypothetical protein